MAAIQDQDSIERVQRAMGLPFDAPDGWSEPLIV